MLNKAFYIILFLSLSCCVQAQKIMRNTSLLNYQRGDRTVLHFGFSLGINYMDYKAVCREPMDGGRNRANWMSDFWWVLFLN